MTHQTFDIKKQIPAGFSFEKTDGIDLQYTSLVTRAGQYLSTFLVPKEST